MSTHSTESPAVLAARLTGTRRAFLALLVDADLGADVRPDRAEVFLTPAGLIDWSRSPLAGDVTGWDRAEVHLGAMSASMRDVRPWGASVPPSWHSAGIVDARAFTVGQATTVHEVSHAGPNRVRGVCGVVSAVIESDRRATWADALPDCATCRAVAAR